MVLRVLPLRDPGRLVFIENVGTQGPNGGPPYPFFDLLRHRARSFEGMAAFSPSTMELGIDGIREQARGVYDARVLLFTLAVSLLSGLAFGLLPALRAARVDPATGLKSGARALGGGRSSLRAGRALFVLQVSLSMVLLASAGLFIRTLRGLESVGLGFARENVLTMEVTPERNLFGDPR